MPLVRRITVCGDTPIASHFLADWSHAVVGRPELPIAHGAADPDDDHHAVPDHDLQLRAGLYVDMDARFVLADDGPELDLDDEDIR